MWLTWIWLLPIAQFFFRNLKFEFPRSSKSPAGIWFLMLPNQNLCIHSDAHSTSVTNSPHLACSFDGCSRWFHNVSGLKKHIQAQHSTDNACIDLDSSTSGLDPVRLSGPHFLSPIDLDHTLSESHPDYCDIPSTPSPYIPFTMPANSLSSSSPSAGSSCSWDFELHPFPVSPP